MPLVLRRDKTTPLTYVELDGNFEYLEDITNTILSSSDVRGLISVTDAGGDGSLSYNSSTGVITYTGPGASEVRAHISGGAGITFTSGVISIGNDAIKDTMIDFGTGSGQISTDDLPEGSSNLYFTNARADARVAAASVDTLADVDTTTSAPTVSQVLTWDGSNWKPANPPGLGGGEANTGSNVGTGAGIFKQKVGVDLEHRSIIGSDPIVATENTNDITFTFVPSSNLDINGNKLINVTDPTSNQDAATKAYVDSQISGFDLNTVGDTGTGSVTLDSQTLSIVGTANKVVTSVSGQTVTLTLPATIASNLTGDVTGNLFGNAQTASTLENPRLIGGVSFDGSGNINLPGVNAAGNQDTSGNAASADAWSTARTITLGGDLTGNVSIDGSSDVTLTASLAANSVALGTDTTGNYIATIVGTANQIEVTGSGVESATISLAFPDNVTINDTLTVAGNLVVNGTTTTVNTTNTAVTDNVLALNSGVSSNANDSGIIIERGSTGDNAFMGWDESADKFIFGTTTSSAETTGDLAVATGTVVAATFEGNLIGDVTGDVTGNADTATALATARTIGGVSFDGSANINLPGVNTAGNQNTSGNAATATLAATATNVTVTANNTTNETVYVTFVDGATGAQGIETDTNLTYNPSTNVLATTATEAKYADLAEVYAADNNYSVGTIVKIGGEKEITQTISEKDSQVFGVISESPAYLMNSGADGLPVALTGRVSVKVLGVVAKGQRIVSSNTPGVGIAVNDNEIENVLTIVGRALESSNNQNEKLIECAVGKL